MLKPSDFLAVRIVVHPVWSQNLMAVAARVCMSVTQRQETAANLSQNCNTKLFRDLRDSPYSSDRTRANVCLQVWCWRRPRSQVLELLNIRRTLGGSLATIETTRPDDKSVADLSC